MSAKRAEKVTETHVVLGSGTVGTKLASRLSAAGKKVVLISRSTNSRPIANVECVKGDASSISSLLTACPKADFIYNCVNPPYDKWDTEWPPIQKAIIELSMKTDAVLVTCSNLYGYGPHQGVLTEDVPLRATWKNGRIRADMWLEVKELHDAGKIRATEVRGSDYISASDQSRMGDRVVPRLMQGAEEEVAWGKPWHVPSNEPMTQRNVVHDIAKELGVQNPKVTSVPIFVEKMLGVFNPVMRELSHTAYQFNEPFIMSDENSRKTFGLQPKPWNQIISDLVSEYAIQ
jgi:nucleoside-diphosphate-sugar epimerase